MGSHLFGEHLRREREMRGVSLEEISAATRISMRFLEALEGEHWERLPGGIFNRGFIRSISKFLGLDEESLIAEYALETRERPEIAIWTKEPVKPRFRWGRLFATVSVLLLLCAGGWFLVTRYGPAIRAWHDSHPIVQSLLAHLHRNKAAAGRHPSGNSSIGQDARSSPDSVADKAPASSNAASANGVAQNSASSNLHAGSASVPVPAKSTGADAPLELKVEAGETSDVTVIADGKSVFSGKLEAMRTLSFHAQKSFTVSSDKSNAVLLELNGRTVPPLGPPGQPGKITLTHENLNSNPGGED